MRGSIYIYPSIYIHYVLFSIRVIALKEVYLWFYTLLRDLPPLLFCLSFSSPSPSHSSPPSPPQDGYEHVCAHTEHGIEFVKRAASFVEKLIHVEQNYAKELRYVYVYSVSGKRDGKEGGRRR